MKTLLIFVMLYAVTNIGNVDCDPLRIQTYRTLTEMGVVCFVNDFGRASNLNKLLEVIMTKLSDGNKEEVIATISRLNQSVPFSPQGINTTGNITESSAKLMVNLPLGAQGFFGPYKCKARGWDSNFMLVEFTTNDLNLLPPQPSETSLIAEPTDIRVGLTKSLTIHCSVADQAISGINQIISMELFRTHGQIQQLIAQVDMFSGVNIAQGVDQEAATATGLVGANSGANYLNVTWAYPTSSQAGYFSCKTAGLDKLNSPVLFSAGTTVRSSDAAREELTRKIRELYGKNDACEKQNKKLVSDLSVTSQKLAQAELLLKSSCENSTSIN